MLARIADDLVLLGPWKRFGVALVAGGLSALAMAPVHAGPVLFVTLPALVFLLDGAESARPGAGWLRRALPAFAVGWAFGFGYFVAGLWWIGKAFLVEAEEFAALLPFAVAGLPAVLAIFHGLAAVVARALSADGWTRVVALAFAFAGAEWLRGHLFTGFPWNALGYAMLVPGIPTTLAQAGWWGLHGTTFVAILFGAMPALLVRPRGVDRLAAAGFATLGLTALLVPPLVAPSLVAPSGAGGAQTRLRLVQPDVDQREKWAPGRAAPLFERHVAMSRAEPLDGIDAVIWPESAFAFLLQREPDALAAIGDLLPPGVTLITGGMRGEDFLNGVPARVWNSVLVVDEGGAIVGSGDKTHLVPFGEYLPFGTVLRAIGLRQLVERGGFEEGAERLTVRAAGATFLPLICYEVIFSGRLNPDGAARPDYLLNLTNDGWFGLTPGPYQHAHQAQVRAAEEGLPMVRVANSGISFVADARGRVVARMPLGARDTLDIDLPPAARPTVFSRWGDLPFTFTLFIVLAALVFARRRKSLYGSR